MLVSELIELLLQCDQSAEIIDAWENEITGVDEDCDENDDPQTVMILS